VKGQETLENMLKLMGISQYEVKSRIEEDSVILDIKSEAEGLLIGRHGKTREAIQYLVDRISNNTEKEKIKYIIDIGGYLNRHRETLEKIAARAITRVRETQREEHLEAMSAFDRRIIHLYLRENLEVKTYSLGEGGLRHIVIAPKNQPETEA
jgi:spoIIIJ-associated protein